MADETKPTDAPKAAPKKPATPPDQSVPGGLFIQGGHAGDDDKHYGGRVVNANGEVVKEFADDEVNTGKDTVPDKPFAPPKQAAQQPDPFKGAKK